MLTIRDMKTCILFSISLLRAGEAHGVFGSPLDQIWSGSTQAHSSFVHVSVNPLPDLRCRNVLSEVENRLFSILSV